MVTELIHARPYATEAGTARFVARHGAGKAADAYTLAGQLAFSSLGLGTCMGRPDAATDAAYVAAIVDAVRRGVNVLDTASSYRGQRSERALGTAIRQLVEMGEVYRSELIVATKAGLVPSDADAPADPGQLRANALARGLCDADEICAGCHCIAPRFLTAMLEQSRANLGLETLDVCFVHNPEAQLHVISRDLLEDRLRRAFAALEAAADAGHVRVYGVATWSGLRARPEDRDHLSLERIVRCAEDVAGSRHRLKAVQLPVSLAAPEAVVRADQRLGGEAVTALEAARRLGLVVFAASSLHQGRLARAPIAESREGGALGPAALALQFARSAPGVTTALVGMASTDHVRENTGLLAVPKASAAWVAQLARVPAAGALQPLGAAPACPCAADDEKPG